MLLVADILLSLLHLLVIGFNLLGWIWRASRKLHLLVAGITLGCWFLLGIWYGIGYCPLTDWQWHIKAKLGESDLPDSFIKYLADRITGQDFSAEAIDWLTGLCFLFAIVLSVYLNFSGSK